MKHRRRIQTLHACRSLCVSRTVVVFTLALFQDAIKLIKEENDISLASYNARVLLHEVWLVFLLTPNS